MNTRLHLLQKHPKWNAQGRWRAVGMCTLGCAHNLPDGNSDIDRHLLLPVSGMFGALTLRTTDWTQSIRYSNLVVLKWGQFCPPLEDTREYPETFLVLTSCGRGVDTGIQLQARDSAEYPTMLKSAPIAMNHPAQNVGSAETKKPCTNSLKRNYFSNVQTFFCNKKTCVPSSVYSSQHHIFI